MGWLFDEKKDPAPVTLRNGTKLKCVACAGEIFSKDSYASRRPAFQEPTTCWVCTECGFMHWVLRK